MFKAIKVRIYPTTKQRELLAYNFGAARWVYNWGLELRSTAYKENRENIYHAETKKRLTALKGKKETEWLKLASSEVLFVSLENLDVAFERFFDPKLKSKYPRFKNKHGVQSITYPAYVRIENGSALRIPKIGNIKAVLHREIIGKIKTVTISLTTTGKYFAAISIEDDQEAPKLLKAVSEHAVRGIDLGLTHLAITDIGEKVANPRFMKRAATNLRRKQKALSRKKIGSANRNKARLLVAKAHERTRNARDDFQHKLSNRLIDENQAICTETLRVENMVKNRRLAKHISDAAWSELLVKVQYKAAWAGKHFTKINPFFPSSKTCSGCGHKVDELPLKIRHWTCPGCGVVHDRDINAAINIKRQGILKLKAEGLSVSAC